MTQLVGRFVALEWPSSSFEGTKTYGIRASSHMTGKCEMISMGVISAARIKMLKFERLMVEMENEMDWVLALFRPS